MARTTIATPGFLDRLGDRVVVTDRTGGDLEVLRLRPELTGAPEFEACLKSTAEQLAAFQHRCLARVRGISRLPAPDGRLAIVSDTARGWRLSEVLQAAEQDSQLIHTSTVLFILRQVASAIAALQSAAPGVAHGALGPERVVLSPAGRVVVVEYVLGAALEYLPASSPDKLWKELRIAVPADAAAHRFTPHTDVLQLGIIALSLIHNRPLRRDEYPSRLVDLLDGATESRVTGARQPIGGSLRRWLEQSLGIAPDAAAWTMEDAQRGLDWIVSKEGGYLSTPVGLEPLLQAVDRFFTVPPASDDDVPADASVGPDVEAPAEARAGKADALPNKSAQAEAVPDTPAAPDVAAPAPVVAAPPKPPAPPEAARVLEAETPATAPRVLTLVRPAEHHSDPFPVPPDVTPGASTRTTRPVPPAPASPADLVVADLGVPDLAPVADMLSIDRPTSPRRSGWSGEAWLSHSSERGPSGPRAVAASAGTTARISKSGGVATAALRREAPVPEPAPLREELPLPEPVAAPLPEPVVASKASRPAPSGDVKAADAPPRLPASSTSGSRETSPASAAPRPSAPSASRTMFGVDSTLHEEHAEADRTAAGGKLKWLALAAVVILCAGGFAGWTLLKPSAGDVKNSPAASTPAEQPAAAASPTATAAAPPAAQPEAPRSNLPTTTPGSAAAPVAEAAPATGAVQLVSPLAVAISEKGEALGTSAAPVAMTAGRHVLDVTNDEVGYRATQVVDVRPGRTTRIQLALPRGAININATPWAEVLVDGQRLGETPLGNVQLTVGSHEVRFRHPQLGEQVRTVLVTTGSPGRLSVDMKQ